MLYSPASPQCFARTYRVYRSSTRLSTSILQLNRRARSQAATAQNIKTTVRLDIEARSSKLLNPFGFRLGICCSGLGLVRLAYSTYTVVKRLDCAPACHHHPYWAPARSICFCCSTSVAHLYRFAQPTGLILFAATQLLLCDSLRVSRARDKRNPLPVDGGGKRALCQEPQCIR